MLTRRIFTLGTAATVLTASTQAKTTANATEADMTNTAMDTTDWANLTESEWQDRLTAMEFNVLRDEGTERAGTSPLNDEKRAGTFVCAGCALPLFKTATKYESGTGWPSFFDYIPGALGMKEDRKFFMKRTEYHCSRCGGHQGHVFKDGPRPTGLRYCNNGVALDFVPDA